MMGFYLVRIVITRPVSPRIGECELSFLARRPIDAPLAARQHEEYERRLEARGCTIVRAPATPELPDSVFVEDAAVVLDEVAVIARPGAVSRRQESESLRGVLEPYRALRRIEAPATLDGGDVLRIGRTIFAGRSRRTNTEGIEQLRAIASAFGYEVLPVDFHGCLHLKSAVTEAADGVLLVNPEWIDASQFPGFDIIDVDPGEAFAANVLRLGGTLLHGASHPRTRHRLERHGLRVEPLDLSEMEKAEGGVTCCSIILETAL